MAQLEFYSQVQDNWDQLIKLIATLAVLNLFSKTQYICHKLFKIAAEFYPTAARDLLVDCASNVKNFMVYQRSP